MEIIFLGTGPARGIRSKGKSARLESSVLVETAKASILIDVTTFFVRQLKWIKKIDAILITHAHKDAIGGIGQLVSWMRRQEQGPIPLFSHSLTIKKILKRFQKTSPLLLKVIKNSQSFKIGQAVVTPFFVKHSIQSGFPTSGYHLSLKGKRVAYVSDVASWDRQAERFMKDADILIIDGAMWGKRMIAHLDIKKILPKICRWPVKRIIFTQIGHTAPKHEILQREIKKICKKALPAFDGMRLKLDI